MLATHLTDVLIKELPWNKARLNCFGILLVAVIRFRTVNLVKLAAEASNDAIEGSLYRRFQNFFLRFSMPVDDIGRLVLSKLPKPSEGWTLAVDRTNWKFGKTHINILAFAVLVGKVAIPVSWIVLPQKTKRGNSNFRDRKAVMKRVLKIISASDIHVLTIRG